MFRSLSFLAIVVFLQSACSSKNPHPAPNPYSAPGKRESAFFDVLKTPDSYVRVFNKHTLQDRSHSEFEPVITGFATYWNREVREAYVRERAWKFRLTPEQEKDLATEELQEDESFFVFIVTIATGEYEWNKLEDKKGLFRTTLENPEGSIQLEPERIEVISQRDEVAKYFYRQMDPFTRTYRIRFPKAPLSKSDELDLHISGPRGSIKFAFDRSSEKNPDAPSGADLSKTSE